MKSYMKDFIAAAINDVEVSEDFLIDYVTPLVTDFIGEVEDHRFEFIKPILTVTDITQIEKICVHVVEGEVETFSKMVGIDCNNIDDIENKRDVWEQTEFAPDFEVILEDVGTDIPDDDSVVEAQPTQISNGFNVAEKLN